VNTTGTFFFRDIEDDMIMREEGELLRVSHVEQFEDAGVTRFDVASLDGSYRSTEWEREDDELVEIVDECDEDLSEEAFLDFLDSVYGDEVQVCGYAMNPGRILRTMDNVAFTQMHNDWTDMHETECGQH